MIKGRAGFGNGVPDGETFSPLFPSATAGDGRVRPNNARPGNDQPDARPSAKRKVRCRQCGFLVDKAKNASDGGSMTGDGAGGIITTASDGAGGNYGDQAYRPGAGCPNCFSKNFSA
jgi:hypothetical protein